jgi:hypothetical protein
MGKWLGLAVGFGLVTAALGTACSSTQPTPNADVTTFCANKAQAECQIATSPCVIPTATCLSVREEVCQQEAAAATADGTRSYYQPNAQACLSKVQSSYSGSNGGASTIPFSDLYGTGSIDDLCNRVFQGKSGNNMSCTTNYDCTNGNVCTIEGTSGTGLCGPATPVAAGGFCGEPGQECATGTYCQASSTGGAATCAARPTLGAACNDVTSPCLETLRCLDGQCAARETTGGVCNPTRVAGDPNADCDPTTAPLCDTSDPAAGYVCTAGLSFARGADDCTAYSTVPGSSPGEDAGAGDTGTVVDSGSGADTGSASDAGVADAGKD